MPGSFSCSTASTGMRTRSTCTRCVELDAPERRGVAALAAERERRRREELEVEPAGWRCSLTCRWPCMTSVAPISASVSANALASSRRIPISVGARLPTPCGQRHDVVVEEDDAVARAPSTRAVFASVRSHASCSGPMAPLWRKNARCGRAHESSPTRTASASASDALPRAARARASSPRRAANACQRRALALVRRPRAGAAGDREEIEIVVAREWRRAGRASCHARERRLDELPAVAVVGAVAGERRRRRRRCSGRPRAPRAAGAGSSCAGVVSSIDASAPSLGGARGERRRAPRLEAARLRRRALDRIEQTAALARARDGVRVAVGIDEHDLPPFLLRCSRRTRQPASSQHDLEARLRSCRRRARCASRGARGRETCRRRSRRADRRRGRG